MSSSMSRRQFALSGAALSLTALAPTSLRADAHNLRKVVVRLDSEVGVISPRLHGQFVEHLGSCVYGGIWVGRDSSIPNINGYRRQAVEYLRGVGVPVLRWPGGCFADDYHWRDGIGPRRPKRVNIHWGGYVEDNSFGTHEFIGFCRLIGAEPYFAGNVGSGSPEEMRDWLEYCNYPSGSTLAEERAANGSPEPFRVRLWGVGNESWGCGGQMRPEEYADQFRRFAAFLRSPAFGSDTFLVACGPHSNDSAWSRGVIDAMGSYRYPDGFSMHYYEGGERAATVYTPEAINAQFAEFTALEKAIVQQRDLLDGYHRGRKVAFIIDEWGVWDSEIPGVEKRYGRLWQQSTMRSAVAAGLGLNVFNRQSDKLYMCNIAQMVNVLQSLLLTDGPEGKHCVRTTTYYAFALFEPHRGKTAVRVETDDASPLALSISASRTRSELVISFVNPRFDEDMHVECSLYGGAASQGSAQMLQAADFNAYNSFDDPDKITPQFHPIGVRGAKLQIDLPRMSVATARLKLTE